MRTIFKYEFPVQDIVELKTHQLFRILSYSSQRPGTICMWAIVESDSHPETQTTKLAVFGTGHSINFLCPNVEYSSFQATVFDRGFVWHIFEIE